MATALSEPTLKEAVVTDKSKLIDYLDCNKEDRDEEIKLLSRALEFTVTENQTILQIIDALQEAYFYEAMVGWC